MIRGWTGWALGTPDRCRRRLVRSPRLRVLRLLWETSPRLLIVLGLYILADGVLALVALGARGRRAGRGRAPGGLRGAGPAGRGERRAFHVGTGRRPDGAGQCVRR